VDDASSRSHARSDRASLALCHSVGFAVRSAVGAIVLLLALSPPLAGAASPSVIFVAVLNGVASSSSSDAHPAELYSNSLATIRVTVTNRSATAIEIATVRFQGDVLDLPLFSYDSAIDLKVPAHHTESLVFPVGTGGIGSQATGLVSATITALGTDGGAIASDSVVTNIHGSLRSIYGLFGLAVLLLTASSLLLALLAMAGHRLPSNRWVRAVRFAIPGFGIGLVMTFTLAALGLFTPGPGHWLPLLIATTATGLAFGYLTPAPNEAEFGEEDDDVLLAEIVVVDEDPLEAAGSTEDVRAVVTPVGSVPDGRVTAGPAPDGRPTAGPVPDGRATAGPS